MKKKILHLDDDPGCRFALSTGLLRAGFDESLEAGNNYEAFEILHREPVDLVIQDMTM